MVNFKWVSNLIDFNGTIHVLKCPAESGTSSFWLSFETILCRHRISPNESLPNGLHLVSRAYCFHCLENASVITTLLTDNSPFSCFLLNLCRDHHVAIFSDDGVIEMVTIPGFCQNVEGLLVRIWVSFPFLNASTCFKVSCNLGQLFSQSFENGKYALWQGVGKILIIHSSVSTTVYHGTLLRCLKFLIFLSTCQIYSNYAGVGENKDKQTDKQTNKQNPNQNTPTNGFFPTLFLLRIREAVSSYWVQITLLSSFPEDQSWKLLAGAPLSCVLTYCRVLSEDNKYVIQICKSEIRKTKGKSICNSLSALYEYSS